MSKIIKNQDIVYIKKYIACYFIYEMKKSFVFECNINGIVDATRLKIEDYNNYKLCINPTFKVDKQIKFVDKQVKTSILLKCDCNNEFYLTRPVTYCMVCGKGFYPNGKKLQYSDSQIKISYCKVIK